MSAFDATFQGFSFDETHNFDPTTEGFLTDGSGAVDTFEDDGGGSLVDFYTGGGVGLAPDLEFQEGASRRVRLFPDTGDDLVGTSTINAIP